MINDQKHRGKSNERKTPTPNHGPPEILAVEQTSRQTVHQLTSFLSAVTEDLQFSTDTISFSEVLQVETCATTSSLLATFRRATPSPPAWGASERSTDTSSVLLSPAVGSSETWPPLHSRTIFKKADLKVLSPVDSMKSAVHWSMRHFSSRSCCNAMIILSEWSLDSRSSFERSDKVVCVSWKVLESRWTDSRFSAVTLATSASHIIFVLWIWMCEKSEMSNQNEQTITTIRDEVDDSSSLGQANLRFELVLSLQ